MTSILWTPAVTNVCVSYQSQCLGLTDVVRIDITIVKKGNGLCPAFHQTKLSIRVKLKFLIFNVQNYALVLLFCKTIKQDDHIS